MAELEQTGFPFPTVAHTRKTPIVQLIAAVEAQLKVFIEDDI
jgi:hypothetical protein